MQRYRIYAPALRQLPEYRALSKPDPNARTLVDWLITGGCTTIIPGLLCVGRRALFEQIGWDDAPEDVQRRVWAEVLGCGLVRFDPETQLVWLPVLVDETYMPDQPNVLKGWRTAWAELPDCDLKHEAWTALAALFAARVHKRPSDRRGKPDEGGTAFAQLFVQSCPEPRCERARRLRASLPQEPPLQPPAEAPPQPPRQPPLDPPAEAPLQPPIGASAGASVAISSGGSLQKQSQSQEQSQKGDRAGATPPPQADPTRDALWAEASAALERLVALSSGRLRVGQTGQWPPLPTETHRFVAVYRAHRPTPVHLVQMAQALMAGEAFWRTKGGKPITLAMLCAKDGEVWQELMQVASGASGPAAPDKPKLAPGIDSSTHSKLSRLA